MNAVARRVIQFVIVLWLVATFTFTLIRIIPGDPIDILFPTRRSNPQAQEKVKQARKDLGLDKPILTQYVNYLGEVATFDLGEDYGSGREVTDIVKKALPVSLQLMLYAQILALAFAIPFGVFTAYRAGSRADRAVSATSFGLLALPNFVLGLILAFLIGGELKLLPSLGYTPGWLDPIFTSSRTGNIFDHIESMILPSITLAVGQIAIYTRLLRSDMIATLQENYITMARSKGISDRRILWRHALRPSSITLLTVAGLNVGTLIGGAVIIEVIFNMGGMGSEIARAYNLKQFNTLQSLILVVAALFVLVNFLVDLLYTLVDPRIRHARAAH